MYVIHEPKDLSFDKVGIKGKRFPMNPLTKKLQHVLIQTDKGHATTIIEHKCDFIYYILEGSGYFLINEKKERCEKGDLVVIPAGNKFIYKGKFKILLVSSPPWYEEQEETL